MSMMARLFTVVAMEKEIQARNVHEQGFRERKRFTYKTSQPLPQRVIPTLHMSGFPGFLSHSGVLLFWNDRLIGLPKIRVAVPGTIGWWNGLPQATTCLFASISYCVSNHLTRLAAQSDPDPGLIRLLEHK